MNLLALLKRRISEEVEEAFTNILEIVMEDGGMRATRKRKTATRARKCECGCGQAVGEGRRFVRYHHLRVENEKRRTA